MNELYIHSVILSCEHKICLKKINLNKPRCKTGMWANQPEEVIFLHAGLQFPLCLIKPQTITMIQMFYFLSQTKDSL